MSNLAFAHLPCSSNLPHKHTHTHTLVTKFEAKLKNHHPDHFDTPHAQRRTKIEREGTHHQEQTPTRAPQITLKKMLANNTLKARTLLRLISGSVLTLTQARKQGHLIEISCPMCGEPDTVPHRIHTCFCSATTGDKLTYPTTISQQRGLHMLPPIPQAPPGYILSFLARRRLHDPVHL